MASVRIPAVVFALLVAALLSVQLSAQPTPQGTFAVQVTEICGDVIPGARVEIDPSLPKPGPVQETDRQGQAVFAIPIGTHTLSITFKGLEQWSRQIDVRGGDNPPVDATLYYAGMIVDCVSITSVDNSGILTKTPDPIFLSLQPLHSFGPLPARPMKIRW
jgi:hypothetical protein